MASQESSSDTKSPAEVAKYLRLYDSECPTSQADVEALVEKHGLHHGDVVAFSEYRDSESYIVSCQEDGTVTLIKSPDQSASSDLTIPVEVLAKIHDSVTFYRDIIANSADVNLNLSPKDKYVVDHLGHVPNDWKFNMEFLWGEMETFAVKVPGNEWDIFIPSTVSREVMQKRYFSGSPLVSVRVTVDLHGTEYHEYQSKYGWDSSPSIPSSWLREGFGGGSSGPEHRSWGWRFTGPQSEEETVRKSIMDFLKGFTYHFE